MSNLSDPMSYLWPGDVPRYFMETPPPRRPVWRWWEEKDAPNINDFLDWRFRTNEHEGSALVGLVNAFLIMTLIALIIVLIYDVT